jgi:hypothetical protein
MTHSLPGAGRGSRTKVRDTLQRGRFGHIVSSRLHIVELLSQSPPSGEGYVHIVRCIGKLGFALFLEQLLHQDKEGTLARVLPVH